MKNPSSVQIAKLALIRSEFPFLDRYIENESWLAKVPRVCRLGTDIFECRGCTAAWYIAQYPRNWPEVISGADRRYVFIDAAGAEIGQARPADAEFFRDKPSFRNLWHPAEKRIVSEAETVLEALRRMPDANVIAYVLMVSDEYRAARSNPNADFMRDLLDTSGLIIGIYKKPKGQSLAELIKDDPSVAREALNEDLARVDEDGNSL